jgi:hypothetical protein
MRPALALLFLAAPLARADEKPAFEIDLTVQKSFYPDEFPDLKCTIRNAGKGDGFVLGPVDGAFDGLRAMVSYRERVTFNGQAHPRRTDLRRIDNYVNAIRATDLVSVKAGQKAQLPVNYVAQFYTFTTPGKYTVALTYEFDPMAADKIDGGAFEKKVRALPAVKASGKVEFAVLQFPPAVARGKRRARGASCSPPSRKRCAPTRRRRPTSAPRRWRAWSARPRT